MKKRENEIKLKEEQERKYQTMFKPNKPVDTRSDMFSRAESPGQEFSARCQELYRRGTERIAKKRTGLSE